MPDGARSFHALSEPIAQSLQGPRSSPIPTVLVFMETVTQEQLIQLLATGDSPVIRSLQLLSLLWRSGGGTESQTTGNHLPSSGEPGASKLHSLTYKRHIQSSQHLGNCKGI